MQPDLTPYQDPDSHEAISAIIRRHSRNPDDLRFAAFRDLELHRVNEALDLGCGFGYMAEEIARRIAATGRITGVDACPGNERIFLRKVSGAGRRARFVLSELGSMLPWADETFDLCVCSFALYFFPHIVPEVARVLTRNGAFVALTHSEGSFLGLLRALDLSAADSPLPALVRRFSAENGAALLSPCFHEMCRIDYSNSLAFLPEDADDLCAYLQFKMPLLSPGSGCDSRLLREFESRLRRVLGDRGMLLVEKDDAIFICRRPRRP